LSGWVTDPDWQEFALMNDELDESDGEGPAADGYPVTFIVSSIARRFLALIVETTSIFVSVRAWH
jgi:hypothetical protein